MMSLSVAGSGCGVASLQAVEKLGGSDERWVILFIGVENPPNEKIKKGWLNCYHQCRYGSRLPFQ